MTHFMLYGPDGKLWCVDTEDGTIFRGIMPADGSYFNNAERLGFGYHHFSFLAFTKDTAIDSIISFEFLPKQGKRISESPEVIEERVYNNSNSSVPLKHTFAFEKSVKSSSSFSHKHGFTFGVGAEIKFKAGVPFIGEAETTIKLNLSTSHEWSFTETNETTAKFSSSSNVVVPPGKAIRVMASVLKADLVVPYRAKITTLFGYETEIEGVWNGVTHYNLMVTQKDYIQSPTVNAP
ncbi:hypothetical protein GDO81_022099 [Engystomops pustulosus]|uniref:Uncharacterized protein n=1 Tax=Engystomops pustulosus TaxID=76066 RepID=A0AAV6ZBL9_ENGPU|nr:hypothetical protein GDO81_022099 [Engystomops pustulosus]